MFCPPCSCEFVMQESSIYHSCIAFPVERAQSAISLWERKLENIMQELVMRKIYAKVDGVALVPIVASIHVVPIVAALYIP